MRSCLQASGFKYIFFLLTNFLAWSNRNSYCNSPGLILFSFNSSAKHNCSSVMVTSYVHMLIKWIKNFSYNLKFLGS